MYIRPADVDESGMAHERVGRDPDARERQRGGDPHRRHPHRGERAQHALHVAGLEVDPRTRTGRPGLREQRRDRPRLQQPQPSVVVESPLHVLRCAGALLQPSTGRAQLGELGGVQAPQPGGVDPSRT